MGLSGGFFLRNLIKETRGRCLQCHRPCPAEVWLTEGEDGVERVHFKRDCPDHGVEWTLVSSDARFYFPSHGPDAEGAESSEEGDCGDSCGCGVAASEAEAASSNGINGPETMERLSTCLALIEIVDSCNLRCPTCYADSPPGAGDRVAAVPLEEIKERIQGVIDRKGPLEILQLSGGEPTLHPLFFELVEWVGGHPDIDYLLLNTNGVRIATDDEFLARLGEAVDYGHMQAYLQFDGTREAGQRTLRGADLREMKTRAVERCGEIGLPLTLAMTVIPENLDQLWDSVAFGLEHSHVRGVSFQPMFSSGRSACGSTDTEERRLNVADIILGLVEQSGGKLDAGDFTPMPCGDPNCHTIGYLLRYGGAVRSIGDFVDFRQVQGFLQDRLRYRPEDLEQCGCESEPLGELLKQLELDETHTFRLFIKPFMDAHSWDEDRIARCCTHVIRPDGKLDSFCRYYSGFADCRP